MDESKARSERIRELIGIYGADFDRWPATEGLGRPVLDAELQKLRDAEDELDLLIAGAAVPEPSAALRHRILDIPERRVRQNAWNGLWIVSGAVGAIFAELDGKPMLGATVKSGLKAVDNFLSAPMQVANRQQRF